MELGRWPYACELLEETWGVVDEVFDEEHSDRWILQQNFGGVLYENARFEEAEALLVEAQAHLERLLGPADPATRSAAKWLFYLYEHLGRPEDAERYR